MNSVIIGRIAKSVPRERVQKSSSATFSLHRRDPARGPPVDPRQASAAPRSAWIETGLDADSLNITTWV